MIQLKLTLTSKRPNRVYALNGKSYKLQPGPNVLNLEYEDYLSLAKALHITPVENTPVATEPVTTESEQVADKVAEEKPAPEMPVENEKEPEVIENSDKPEDTHTDESTPVEESTKDETVPEVDYTIWSTTKLKAEYKSITGNACKLKKEEIIAFLQERSKNA